MRLVTGGCSFTAGDYTWPNHLANIIKFDLYNVGVGSASNPLITRRVIHQLQQFDNFDDVLVIVMWSGSNRKSFYFDDKEFYKYKVGDIINIDSSHADTVNPVIWPDEDKNGYWCLATGGMRSKYITNWYKNYQNTVHSLIESYEAILTLQWYLKLNNIKYVFAGYKDDWKAEDYKHVQTDNLRDMIDFTYFIEDSQYEWLVKNSNLPWRNLHKNDNHPSRLQHRQYVREVMLPFLQQKVLTKNNRLL